MKNEPTPEMIERIKKYLLSKPGAHEIGTPEYVHFVIKFPVEKITDAKLRNLKGRVRHFFSQYRTLPYIPYRNGTFSTTYFIQKVSQELISVYTELNADGSETLPEFKTVPGVFVEPYATRAKGK